MVIDYFSALVRKKTTAKVLKKNYKLKFHIDQDIIKMSMLVFLKRRGPPPPIQALMLITYLFNNLNLKKKIKGFVQANQIY